MRDEGFYRKKKIAIITREGWKLTAGSPSLVALHSPSKKNGGISTKNHSFSERKERECFIIKSLPALSQSWNDLSPRDVPYRYRSLSQKRIFATERTLPDEDVSE